MYASLISPARWASLTRVCLNGLRSWYLSRSLAQFSWLALCSSVSVSFLSSRNSVLRSLTSDYLSKSFRGMPSSRTWTCGTFSTHLYERSYDGSGPSTNTYWGVAGLSNCIWFPGDCSLSNASLISVLRTNSLYPLNLEAILLLFLIFEFFPSSLTV